MIEKSVNFFIRFRTQTKSVGLYIVLLCLSDRTLNELDTPVKFVRSDNNKSGMLVIGISIS